MFPTLGKVMRGIKTTRRTWSKVPFEFVTPEFVYLPPVTKKAAILTFVDSPLSRVGLSIGCPPPPMFLKILHSAYSIGAPTGIASGGVAAGRGAAPASFTTLTGVLFRFHERNIATFPPVSRRRATNASASPHLAGSMLLSSGRRTASQAFRSSSDMAHPDQPVAVMRSE